MQPASPYWEMRPDLKGIFESWIQRFQSMVAWGCWLRLVAMQYILVGMGSRGEMSTARWPGGYGQGEEQEGAAPLWLHTSTDLLLGATSWGFYHLGAKPVARVSTGAISGPIPSTTVNLLPSPSQLKSGNRKELELPVWLRVSPPPTESFCQVSPCPHVLSAPARVLSLGYFHVWLNSPCCLLFPFLYGNWRAHELAFIANCQVITRYSL